MSFFKNVWADLVERKLWLVAVGLVIALVAVPVALGRSGGSSSDDAAAPATVAPAHATPATQVVSLTTAKPKGAPLGHAHNPFRHLSGLAPVSPTTSPSVSAAPTTGATPAPASPGGGSAPSPAPTGPVSAPPSNGDISSPAPVPSAPSAPTSPGTPAPVARVAAGWRMDMTYGRAGDVNKRTDVARLSPLNALGSSIALFVGVKDDQNTAVFVILGDVAVSGDGTCRPSPNDCQVIGLHPGDAALIDVASADGSSKRYELQVDKISRKYAGSTRGGINSRHRESRAGRRLLHSAISAQRDSYVAKYRYALAKGVVTKVMPAGR